MLTLTTEQSIWIIAIGTALGIIGCVIGLWCKSETWYWKQQYNLLRKQTDRLEKLGSPVANQVTDNGPKEEDNHEQEGDTDIAERIVELDKQGLTRREIESKVFGYCGGQAYDRVRQVLDAASATMRDA